MTGVSCCLSSARPTSRSARRPTAALGFRPNWACAQANGLGEPSTRSSPGGRHQGGLLPTGTVKAFSTCFREAPRLGSDEGRLGRPPSLLSDRLLRTQLLRARVYRRRFSHSHRQPPGPSRHSSNWHRERDDWWRRGAVDRQELRRLRRLGSYSRAPTSTSRSPEFSQYKPDPVARRLSHAPRPSCKAFSPGGGETP
jgi:hypothetical protein